MNRINGIKTRSISVCATMFLSVWLAGCAHTPDNFQFSEEVINKEALFMIKRVALLDVPTPTGIWLGDPGSGVVAGIFGVAAAFATATHEGGIITSSEKFSEVTRDEMRNWLEEAEIEVILLKAERVKKSKMLRNYDQFKEVDVDAILEIAPIRVGFMEKPFSMSGKLSPDVALTYRLITPGDNQILIESNVFYSSFPGQYADWTGSKLIGPKDHLFKSEESVKEHPEEAARRLKYAITGSTEFISKIVTNTYKEPVTKSVVFTGDFSGTYVSTVTGTTRYLHVNTPNPIVKLEQNGNNITGTFGNSGGKIWGDVEDNTIKFDWFAKFSDMGKGKWIFTPGSSEVIGTWGLGNTWNLKKIE